MLRFRTPAGLVAGLGCIAYCGGCITPAMLAVGVQLVKELERKAAGGSGGKRERTTRKEKALMRFRRIFRGKNQRQKNASSQRSGGYDFSCFLVHSDGFDTATSDLRDRGRIFFDVEFAFLSHCCLLVLVRQSQLQERCKKYAISPCSIARASVVVECQQFAPHLLETER